MDTNWSNYVTFCCVSLMCVIMYVSFIYCNNAPTIVVRNADAFDDLVAPRKTTRSIPTNFYHNFKPSEPINSSCGIAPELNEIKFDNLHWQILQSDNTTFHLLSAYLDVRIGNTMRPTVRVLAMVSNMNRNVETYCQLWFENEVALTNRTWPKYIWRKEWGDYKKLYQPYVISCQVPEKFENDTPSGVSLVAQPCDRATNSLKVVYNDAEEKKEFAVCVKGLDFVDDISARLVEWIELLFLLGVTKIYFYEFHVHEAVKKVLDFYTKREMIEVTPLTLPGDLPNHPTLRRRYLYTYGSSKRLNELMPYNDCFYKHMYQYKFIVLLDIDEVIMPKEGTWADLMQNVTMNNTKAFYDARHVYFIDDFMHHHAWFSDIPKHMYMLQHVYRTKNFTEPGSYVKSFFNTEKVVTLHNHWPTNCLGPCTSYSIGIDAAQLQHYRADCVSYERSCEKLKQHVVMDTTMWNYKQPLIERVQRTLRSLGYLR